MKIQFLSLALLVATTFGASAADANIAAVAKSASQFHDGDSLQPFRTLEMWTRDSLNDKSLRRELESTFIEMAGPASTFEARRFACIQLSVIGTERALPTLAPMLSDEKTAGIACVALGTYPSGKADEVLRKALASAQGLAAVQVINTLGDRRDEKSVQPLARLARSSESGIAVAAMASLGKIGDSDARDALVALGKGLAPALAPALVQAKLQCAQMLADSGDRKRAAALYEELLAGGSSAAVRRAAYGALLRLDKDQGEERINKTLHSADDTLKPVAIAGIRNLKSRKAIEAYGKKLQLLAPQEQVWMIESLTAHGEEATRATLVAVLDSPETPVRLAAIKGLGQIGDYLEVTPLAQRLAVATDVEEQRAIQRALDGFPGGNVTDAAILKQMQKASGKPRGILITTLAHRQGAAANRMLLEETGNADPAAAKAAFRALGRTAVGSDVPKLIEDLTEQTDADVRAEAGNAAAQALARVEPASHRSALVRDGLGRATKPESRAAIMPLLAACGDPDSLAALQGGLRDLDSRVREAALRGLADWPSAAPWDALMYVYRRPENPAFRGIALRGLVRIAGEVNTHQSSGLATHYKQLIDGAEGDAEMKMILGVMGDTTDPEVLPLAVRQLENAGVRPEAEVAVKKIAASVKAKNPQAAEEALAKLKTKS